MKISKLTEQLLADEDFQNDVLDKEKYTREELAGKYGLTVAEIDEARRIFLALTFIPKENDPVEISYARMKLLKKISVSPQGGKNGVMTILWRIAAILSVPLLLSTIFFYRQATTSGQEGMTQSDIVHTFQASAGSKTQAVLPDGTVVWLNSGSSLTCPAGFGSEARRLHLAGEAYFEVAKSKIPMIISAGEIEVKVYGTTLNISAYADEKVIGTTLIEGKVSVITQEDNEHILQPGYTAFYSVDDHNLEMVHVDQMDAFTGWKDGKLLFNNEPFSKIIQKMERWYNVDIRLLDPSLGKYVLYATFHEESIEQVLDILSKSIPITVSYPARMKQADGSYIKREILIKRSKRK